MVLQSHRALEIPELLFSIFGLLDRRSNAKNAQVCKVWFNVALDALWGNVSNLYRLLAVLGPLKGDLVEGYEFKRPPRTADWKRFEKYASHVRQLLYTGYPELKPSVFDQLSKTRRQLEIFPNLQTLDWIPPVNSYVLFMHSGIEKFALNIDNKCPLLAEEIVDRTPHLSELQIRSFSFVDGAEKDLVDMLQHLSSLRKITLPRFYSTEQIIEALSRLKLLSTIEFEIDERVEGRMDTDSFKPTITEGVFPSLRELSVTANFDSGIATFWLSSFPLSALTYFRVYSGLIEKPDSVHRLVCALSKAFQELKTLHLESWRDYNFDRDYSDEDFNDTDRDGNNIALGTLQPLFKLQYLTSLEFYHQYPLLITQQEIEAIASSCPFIENLQLCADPGFCMKSTLTLAALVPLAQHCTHLKSLGLFIDATRVPTMSPNTPPFTSLHTLSVGLSIIKDEMPAVYLSQLIPPECVIECDFGAWFEYEWDYQLEEIVVERCRLWAVVKSLAPKLSSVLAQERLRTRALERKLEDLQVRMTAQQELIAAQGWLAES